MNDLLKEITQVASRLLTRSQNAVYGMQYLVQEQGMMDVWQDATDELCLRLIDIVFGRTRLCWYEILGMADGLSMQGYYFCSIFVVFLLLLGLNSSPLFADRKRGLSVLMKSRGLGAAGQAAGEYLAYLVLVLLCMAFLYFGLNLAVGKGFLNIPEWQDEGIRPLAAFMAGMLPAAAMLAAMQFFLYEAATGIVSGVLLQFICSIGMCYLSGCFYPTIFFPEALQTLGKALPTGAALRCADAALAGTSVLSALPATLFYLFLFLGLSVLVRRYRMQRG